MKKRKNKKIKNETHSFKTFNGAESYFKEILGFGYNSKRNVINSMCSDFITEFYTSNIDDLYDHKLYLIKKKIDDVSDDIEDTNNEILKLENKILSLKEKKNEYDNYLSELKKEYESYISYKKNYKEKSIKAIINRVLLIYIKDVSDYTDMTIQNVFNDYSYNQNFIIEMIYKFLDDNMNEKIAVVDENSDDNTTYFIKLNFSTTKDIKKVLNSLIIQN